jgi:hypothetical protein
MMLIVVVGFGLSACGGGKSQSDADKVRSAVEAVGKDPTTLCTKYGAAAVLKQTGGKDKCLSLVKTSGSIGDPKIKVSNVKITGKTATATVTGGSGAQKGKTDTAKLVKEGNDWKVAG